MSFQNNSSRVLVWFWPISNESFNFNFLERTRCIGFLQVFLKFVIRCQTLQENTIHVTVSFVTTNIIKRDIVYQFRLKCEMSRNVHTPLGTYYNVTEKRFLGKVNRTAQADFEVRMNILWNNGLEIFKPFSVAVAPRLTTIEFSAVFQPSSTLVNRLQKSKSAFISPF